MHLPLYSNLLKATGRIHYRDSPGYGNWCFRFKTEKPLIDLVKAGKDCSRYPEDLVSTEAVGGTWGLAWLHITVPGYNTLSDAICTEQFLHMTSDGAWHFFFLSVMRKLDTYRGTVKPHAPLWLPCYGSVPLVSITPYKTGP